MIVIRPKDTSPRCVTYSFDSLEEVCRHAKKETYKLQPSTESVLFASTMTRQEAIARLIQYQSDEPSKWREEEEKHRIAKEAGWIRYSRRIAIKFAGAMKRQNLLRQNLTDRMACSPQNISRLLKDEKNFSIETICKLEDALNTAILSGDNHKKEYNEPECMHNTLVALGVPNTIVYLDYSGFRTFDLMVLAKRVFGQDSITLISQHWHNQRSNFVARKQGVDIVGFNAKDAIVRKASIKNHIWEMLAKVKAVTDVRFGKKPHFLSEPVIIP